jgi:hypothetical protein
MMIRAPAAVVLVGEVGKIEGLGGLEVGGVDFGGGLVT